MIAYVLPVLNFHDLEKIIQTVRRTVLDLVCEGQDRVLGFCREVNVLNVGQKLEVINSFEGRSRTRSSELRPWFRRDIASRYKRPLKLKVAIKPQINQPLGPITAVSAHSTRILVREIRAAEANY